jgi:16S rRNA pseudouridine516 synthase
MPRLDDLLARNLGCSRTAAARLVQAGRVSDGAGVGLGDRRAEIRAADMPFAALVDGRRHELFDRFHLILHKPLGVVTALRDERHPTAYQLLRAAPLHAELRPVGRLDLETSGLLIWTTDGQWVSRLTHPKRRVPRTYQAALARPFDPLPAHGLELDDGHRPEITNLQPIARDALHPALVIPADASGAALFATITIVGGAYHEVRRIFAALGSHVLALARVAFGDFTLPPDLPPGRYTPIDLAPLP